MGSGVLLAGPEEHNLLLAAITGLVSMEFNQLPLLLPVLSCSRVELQKLHFFGLPATACADDTVRDGNSRYVPPMMRATPVDCVECAMGPPSPRRGIRRFLTKAKNKKGAVPKSTAKKVKSPTDKAGSTADKIREIIALQTFEGFWEWTAELLRLLELNRVEVEKKLNSSTLLLASTELRMRRSITHSGRMTWPRSSQRCW